MKYGVILILNYNAAIKNTQGNTVTAGETVSAHLGRDARSFIRINMAGASRFRIWRWENTAPDGKDQVG